MDESNTYCGNKTTYVEKQARPVLFSDTGHAGSDDTYKK